MIDPLTPLAWTLLALGAVVVGLSKTAAPGGATIAVALYASVLPAKESTGTLLVLLILGDVFALLSYRRDARWREIVRLAPAVLLGLALGALFLVVADDEGVRRVIGVLLLLMIGVTLWRRRRPAGPDGPRLGGPVTAGVYGSLGGFTTMVANAAGPVMSMYLLAARLPITAFLGTSAWFFAIVNIAKLPFSVGIGIITPGSLLIDLVLAPGVVVGAVVGRRLAARMEQSTFERLVVVLTIVGAVYLLV